jgi:two-component system, OmpR family, phosphate regulon sensor histidine kinase PhoR
MAQAGRFALMVWPWMKNSGKAEALPETDQAAPKRLEDGAAAVLQAISATLPDPLLVLDSHGQVLLANPHATEALDQDPSGKHISASVRSPAILDAVTNVLAGGEARRVDFERRVPVVRRFETFIAPVDLPRGAGDLRSTPAVLIVMRDLTREQQLERMRADFVAHASHELRTPLAAVLGFIETLQGPAHDDSTARERFLTLMQAQAERMRRLIDDLLSLSRIEMSVHERPVSVIDLAAVTRLAVDPLTSLARENGVSIDLDLPAAVTVRGDAEALTQVVQNLVENAIKYASSGKRIEVSLAEVDGLAELSVRDFGPGIAAEHLPRLTERFYRVNVQESRSRGGTGLGLAIVKHILNRHRGRLTIQSGLGQGSTFTMRLPVASGKQ